MRRLPADDSELWRRVTRDVAPLRSRPANPPPPPPSPSPASGGGQGGGDGNEATEPRAKLTGAASPPHPPLDRHAGIDRATAERVRRGRYPVEAILDLHGMTQEEAHRALSRFIAASRAAGQRCVLVVTGHGRMGGGVLKAAVPRWLDEPGLRPQVLMLAPARPPDGGGGALYVLLRRLPR
jgi:DNA-nicking Smr family endonuclease